MRPDADRPIWVDNSLSPLVARALKNVGYNAVVQNDVAEFKVLARVLDDEHIIPWLKDRDGIWVHKDDDARTRHSKQMVTAGINTIWLAEPEGADFSSPGQLRLLAYALPEILRDWSGPSPRWPHYEIRPQGADRIRISGFQLADPAIS